MPTDSTHTHLPETTKAAPQESVKHEIHNETIHLPKRYISSDSLAALETKPKAVKKDTVRADSLTAVTAADTDTVATIEIAPEPSFLPAKNLPDNLSTDPAITLTVLFLFFCFSYTIIRGKKIIFETAKDFFYLKERSSIFVESSANKQFINIAFLLIYVGGLSLFLYASYNNFFDYLELRYSHTTYFALIASGIILFLGIKLLTIKFLSYIFLNKNITSIAIKAYLTIQFGFGLCLFPIALCLTYSESKYHEALIIIGGIAAIGIFISIFYKIMQIFLHGIRSFFYIMLYLCALEILPVLIALKIFI